jgi:type I restriction enzyme S subunit
MNADRLLAHFERISEAPDAITRLRRFILDLAVRGKLVEQDPEDEPAEELLGRISYEKARLARAGEIKKPKQLPEVDEAPFVVPSNWTWCRIREATSDRAQRVPSERFTYIDVGAINKEAGLISEPTILEPTEAPSRARKIVKKGDVIYSCVRPYLLNVAIVDLDFDPEPIASTAFAVLYGHELVMPRYLWIVLRTPFMVNCVEESQRGQAYPAINDADFSLLPFPLPPLAEQQRIVAKVDELMALCDQLEAARQERQECRERLVAATLQRLNQPAEDPASLRQDASIALEVLPNLTTTSAQIKQLRQTILNLAVRGKLVEQDPEDEPAEELVKRIAAERTRPATAGKAKNLIQFPEPDLRFAPFVLAGGWAWARFPELGSFGRGKSKHRPRNDAVLFQGGEHLLIQTGDVARSRGTIKTYSNKYNELGLAQSQKWPKGSLCITIAANIADSGILGFDACFPDSVVGFLPAEGFGNARYFEYFMRTAKANLLEFAPATAQKNINLEILTQVLIPLPPLAEQHRIVAKVDELMALCDQLEQQLSQADHQRRRLLEAVLVEVLLGPEKTLEAAYA